MRTQRDLTPTFSFVPAFAGDLAAPDSPTPTATTVSEQPTERLWLPLIDQIDEILSSVDTPSESSPVPSPRRERSHTVMDGFIDLKVDDGRGAMWINAPSPDG